MESALHIERYGCVITNVVTDPNTRKQLWEIYQQAFAAAVEECIQDQLCYNEQSFTETLLDPDYIKFVAIKDGHAIGYALGTSNLEKARITYMNPVRLRRMYPTENLLYVTSLAVSPDKTGARAGSAIIKAIGSVLDERDMMVIFDFSTEKNSGLPDLIVKNFKAAQEQDGWSSSNAVFEPIGSQVYGAVRLIKKSDQ